MKPLRGHAYFIEFAGRRTGGWWAWLVGIAVAAMGAVELASRVRP